MRTKMLFAAVAASLAFTAACEQPAPTQGAAPAPQADGQAQAATDTVQDKPTTAADIRGTTLVTVNDQPIKGETFGIFLNQRLMQGQGKVQNSPQFQNQVINELINIMLLSQAAVDAGLDQNPDIAAALELQRYQSLSRVALQEYSKNNPPSEEELKKRYEERYATNGEEEYKARHILVKTEEEAAELLKQLEGGADFAELAKEHSTGPTGVKGGDLGWFDAGQMVKPFADALKAMEPGGVSDNPVQTQFGWHLIKLEEKRAKQPPAFEMVRANLEQEISREHLTDYVNQLRQKANVNINEQFTKKPEQAAEQTEASAAGQE